MFSFISDDFDENPSWHAECSAPLAVLAYQLGIDPYWQGGLPLQQRAQSRCHGQ
jgi:hypothetical protein